MRGIAWFPVLLLAALPAQAGAATPLVESPSDPRNFTWVEEGVLAVGGGGLTKEQVDWLHGKGFGAIASFRAEHQDPAEHIRSKGIEFLYIPVDHAVNMNLSQLRQFVAWAKEQEAAGRPMYIHCTNGWHRAAAFAAAWEMERLGLSFDEAADRGEDRRPGTVMRAPAPLLEYESLLTGKPGLTVLLQSPQSRPERDGTMPVTVEVLAGSAPVQGAKVEVWSEESGLRFSGKTDQDGLFAFTYKGTVGKSPVDHLYARASAPGLLDGADNVELFYVNPVNPAPLDLEAKWTPYGIEVDVRKHGKHAVSHVLASGPNGWTFVERGSSGEVIVPLPPGGGLVTIRAERWGADPASTTVTVPAGSPPPEARPPPERTPERPATPSGKAMGEWRAKDAPPQVNTAPLPENLRTPAPAPPATAQAPAVENTPEKFSSTRWAALATGGLLVLAAMGLMAHRRGTARRGG